MGEAIGRLKGKFGGVWAATEVWNAVCSQFICDTKPRPVQGKCTNLVCFLALAYGLSAEFRTSCMPETLNSLSKGRCGSAIETISKHELRFYFGDTAELNKASGQIPFPKCQKSNFEQNQNIDISCARDLDEGLRGFPKV